VSSKRRTAGVDRPNGFVFAHIDGRPYSPSYLTHHFRAPQERHGLPPIRFHDLRHGAAILALASGADLKAIQDTLGHASIVLTADTYTVVLPEVAGRTAEGIATSRPGMILTRLKAQVERGAPRGNRTPNPRIKSPLLCQLS